MEGTKFSVAHEEAREKSSWMSRGELRREYKGVDGGGRVFQNSHSCG